MNLRTQNSLLIHLLITLARPIFLQSRMYKRCYLKSLENNSVKIELPDKVEKVLGRCPETMITEKKCSRNQVSLLANCDSETVTVQHLGGNPSTANGVILKNDSQILKHSEVLEFLVGKYRFVIEFEPSHNRREKRKHDLQNGFREETASTSSDQKRICKEESNSTETNSNDSKPCESNVWENIDNGKLYIFTSVGVKSSSKIAAYDMDGTIILTKSGKVFPTDSYDWKLANPSVKKKITKVSSEGFKIVILTNQAGIGRGKTNTTEFKRKIEDIVKALDVPVQVFIATNTSIYRKPAPGMWNMLKSEKNDGIEIDMGKSFYVGDAAGRVAGWAPGKKKDFSSADRLMAINLKLKFLTPEEHFLGEPPGKFALPDFDPAGVDENTPLSDGEIIGKGQEVVIMVGAPGSGKSHFAERHLAGAGYTRVNRDQLGTWQKCVAAMESALATGKSVVIDNTNPDRESRTRFIQRAKGVPCRCFVMTTSLDHVQHNIRFREYTDKNHVPVNPMIINSYRNKFEAPSLSEGFTEIVNINFVPSFLNTESKTLYQMYLLEK